MQGFASKEGQTTFLPTYLTWPSIYRSVGRRGVGGLACLLAVEGVGFIEAQDEPGANERVFESVGSVGG